VGVINHSGDIPLAVFLVFKSDVIGNPMASGYDTRYLVVANESLTAFTIDASLSGSTYSIQRRARSGQRLFDTTLNTFTTAPFSGAVLDRLLDSAATPTFSIDFTITYRTFFEKLLEEMGAEGAAAHNPASPTDSAGMLATFSRTVSSGVRISYRSATKTVSNLPLKLVDKQVTPRGAQPPAVKLVFELDFHTNLTATNKEVMRQLVAMDWSKLARYGDPNVSPTPDYVTVWRRNVSYYLINHTDLDRGEKFRKMLIDDHYSKTAVQLSTDLRNAIDGLIVTANHWGQDRESESTERHQRYLSDLFGSLHQSAWYASPVSFKRSLSSSLGLSADRRAALVLQWGSGHCGEHQGVSYSVLKGIIDKPGSKVTHVVATGNANIDHAFVVYDLDVTEVVSTITTAANNSRLGGAGQSIDVWDLRKAIDDASPKEGYVMDPYLDPSVMRPKASQLLSSIERKQGKPTRFLAFDGEYPSAFSTVDLTSESVATRRTRVPHV